MTPLRVTLCRGCCCGTERKHPDLWFGGLLHGERELVKPEALVRS
jgi:hypothetical protein